VKYNKFFQRKSNFADHEKNFFNFDKTTDSTSCQYFKFSQHILKYNADAVQKLLERLNDASEAENCQVCMWIVERRFPEDY